jgi:hypothetical protein
MLGAMRATEAGLAAELEMPAEGFREAFGEALSKALVKHDSRASFLWLPNFLKYNKPESPNVVRSWPNAFDLIPECDFKYQLFEQLKDFIEGLSEAFPKAFDEAFPKGYAKDYGESVAVAVTVTEKTLVESFASDRLSGSAACMDTSPGINPAHVCKPRGVADAEAKELREQVHGVFAYYLEKAGRDSKLYEFTPLRQNKGMARLKECLRKTGNNRDAAAGLMKVAVNALVASDWNMGRDPKTSGKKYCEWESHLFGSYEQMEKWWNR